MAKELSAIEIAQKFADVKQQLRSLSDSGKLIRFEIQYQDPSRSSEWQIILKSDTRKTDVGVFDETLDRTAQMNGVIRVRVIFRDSHSQTLADITLPTGKISEAIPAPYERMAVTDSEPIVRAGNATQPQSGQLGNISGVLGLLGFDTAGLNGVDDSPIGALTAVMNVRDTLRDNEYSRGRLEEKYTAALEENKTLTDKIAQLQTDLQARDKKIENLEEQLADLEDDNQSQADEIRKRESVAGLAGLALQKMAVGIVKRNPTKVSGLLGISSDELVGMLNGGVEETPTVAEQPMPQVEVEEANPRNEKIRLIDTFLKQVSDQDFEHLTQILGSFAQNNALIETIYNYMLNN